MIKTVLISFSFVPLTVHAQLDTLVVAHIHSLIQVGTSFFPGSSSLNKDYLTVKERLQSNPHRVDINLYFYPAMMEQKVSNKQILKRLDKLLNLVENKLHEVKVLMIENPTQSSTSDTAFAPIYMLNFKKMTSLQTVYILGNDFDNITDMPQAFYSTGTTKIYAAGVTDVKRFKQCVEKRSKSVSVIYDEKLYRFYENKRYLYDELADFQFSQNIYYLIHPEDKDD